MFFLSTCFDYQHSILMLVSQKPFRSHRGLPKKVSNSLEAVLGHRGLQKHGCTLVNLQRCIDQVGNSEIAIGLFSSFTSNFTSRKLTQIRRDTYMYIYIYICTYITFPPFPHPYSNRRKKHNNNRLTNTSFNQVSQGHTWMHAYMIQILIYAHITYRLNKMKVKQLYMNTFGLTNFPEWLSA